MGLFASFVHFPGRNNFVTYMYVTFYTKLQKMTIQSAYKNEPCSPTLKRKAWLLFSVRDMSWGLRKPFFYTLFGQSSVINVTLIALKILTKKKRLIGYFLIDLVKLFELCIFQRDIKTNCSHL